MLAVPGGTDGVSGIPLGTQLPPDRARGLHRFPPEQGERAEHLPQDQRVDIAAERTAVAGGNGRTPEPVHDGWANYFRLGQVSPAYNAIDRHAVRRLRQWLCRKHKVKTGKYVLFPDQRLYGEYGLVRLALTTTSLPWAKA